MSRQAFVVNADLWLEDEVTERNLVLISSMSPTKPPPAKLPSTGSSDLSFNSSVQPPAEENTLDGASPQLTRVTEPSTPLTPITPSQSDRTDHSVNFQDERWKAFSEGAIADQAQQCTALAYMHHMDDEEDRDELQEEGGEDDETGDNLSTQNLVGQTTVAGQTAPDLDGKTSHIWFAFSVLSIRTEGVFKLRFSLFDLSQVNQTSSSIIYQVFSDPIHVQSPKKFLGTCDNNDIANHLNKYSIRIPSRKDEKPTKN
ncbi:hypothetical protein BGZ98_010103 [Dissophora globulifera]|nr:hypothetical protein BGZ98_010103 [Dissophora globulifera]